MAEFLDIIFAFPTVLFTVLMAISFMMLILTVVAGVGADTFDLDLDFSGAEDTGFSFFEILSSFGVGKVPMSIFAAFYFFTAWALSYFLVAVLSGVLGANILVGFGILVVVTLAAFPISGLLLAPLTVLLESDEGATSGRGLIGEVCTIHSGRVDARFGRARCFIDGTELVLNVRCPHENDLTRGDEALIIDFNDQQNTYVVESVGAIMRNEVPQSTQIGETILDEIDFEELEKTTQRHREEKQKVEKTVHTSD